MEFSWKGEANSNQLIVSNKEGSSKGDVMLGVIVKRQRAGLGESKDEGQAVGGHKRVCC